jgi:hypothetical protein
MRTFASDRNANKRQMRRGLAVLPLLVSREQIDEGPIARSVVSQVQAGVTVRRFLRAGR